MGNSDGKNCNWILTNGGWGGIILGWLATANIFKALELAEANLWEMERKAAVGGMCFLLRLAVTNLGDPIGGTVENENCVCGKSQFR